ncbi:MAG: hypothetical protein E5Y12_28815 [Mesorhizobium sp.]|nr:MAG: hypothetical protein E5Y12_28815 [Mesorhizobium sp.]
MFNLSYQRIAIPTRNGTICPTISCRRQDSWGLPWQCATKPATRPSYADDLVDLLNAEDLKSRLSQGRFT